MIHAASPAHDNELCHMRQQPPQLLRLSLSDRPRPITDEHSEASYDRSTSPKVHMTSTVRESSGRQRGRIHKVD